MGIENLFGNLRKLNSIYKDYKRKIINNWNPNGKKSVFEIQNILKYCSRNVSITFT